MKEIVDVILNGLDTGEILIGLKSKRGYGKVKIIELKNRSFDNKQLNDLLDFNRFDINNYNNYEIKVQKNEPRFDYIEVELEQLGGLSIKRYSAKAGEADFEHIKSRTKEKEIPVIPGTSWAGLIRKQVQFYENYLNKRTNINNSIDYWFGKEKETNKNATASNVIIEESHIENAKEISITRSKIDRFSGGAADKSLFTEKSIFNGKTKLGIKVKKEISINGVKEQNKRILGLIALSLKDIENGLVALGGQTSIGRGIFKVNSFKLNGETFDLDSSISNILGGEAINE